MRNALRSRLTGEHLVRSPTQLIKTTQNHVSRKSVRLPDGLRADVHLVYLKHNVRFLVKTLSGKLLCEIIFYLQYVCVFSALKHCNQSQACQIRTLAALKQ